MNLAMRWGVTFVCLCGMSSVAAGQTMITVPYRLDDVWLLPDNPFEPQQLLTGTFEWTYVDGDFENGSGQVISLLVPWGGSGMGPLDTNIATDSIEITLPGNGHDQGVDITLAFLTLLSPDPNQPSSIDTGASAFEIQNGPVVSGTVVSGSVSVRVDDDADGVDNPFDWCPGTPGGEAVDANGCSATQLDDDNDGINNALDLCPGTLAGASVDANGCSLAQRDDDGDGVPNGLDQCPDTLPGEPVSPTGCSYAQLDSDNDGVPNGSDLCPGTHPGQTVDVDGCAQVQLDDDDDGVSNALDQCPGTPVGHAVDSVGCSSAAAVPSVSVGGLVGLVVGLLGVGGWFGVRRVGEAGGTGSGRKRHPD